MEGQTVKNRGQLGSGCVCVYTYIYVDMIIYVSLEFSTFGHLEVAIKWPQCVMMAASLAGKVTPAAVNFA